MKILKSSGCFKEIRMLISFTVGVFFPFVAFSESDMPYRPGVLLEEFLYRTAEFPSCHSSSILGLESGELLCVFFGGTKENHPDVEIRLSRKPVGETWSAPISIASGIRSEDFRYAKGNPILFQPKGGDLFLFYKVNPSGKPWFGEMKISKDEGNTWSEVIRIPDGRVGPDKNKPVLNLKTGLSLHRQRSKMSMVGEFILNVVLMEEKPGQRLVRSTRMQKLVRSSQPF